MTDAMLIDMLLKFVLPAGGLFAAVFLLRWVALKLLYRFAPVWLVGSHGLLIDTKTRMGMLQTGNGNDQWRLGMQPGADSADHRCD
jgi:hypothetical protein